MATLIGFVLARYVAIALFALFAYWIGRRACQGLPFSSAAERIAISTSVGLGWIALFVLGLGLLGALHREVFIFAAVLLVLTSIFVWWRHRRRSPIPDPEPEPVRDPRSIRNRSILVVLLFVASIPFLLFPFYPPVMWDSISYHLAAADIFVEQGAVVLTPYLRFPHVSTGKPDVFSPSHCCCLMIWSHSSRNS